MQAAAAMWERSWSPLRQRLADFRVVISFLLLTAMFAHCVLAGARPREWFVRLDLGAWAAVACVAAGVWIRSWAAGYLRKGCGLTMVGPYSICRHPLYVGSFLMLVGFCHLLVEAQIYVPIVASIVIVHLATLRNEECRLAQKFGMRWTNYAEATPRFVPRLLSRYVAGRWDVRQWLRNREYRAVGTSMFGLMLLEIWRRI